MTDAAIESALDSAESGARIQRRMSFDSRSARLSALAEALEAGKAEYARLMTDEMGKTLRAAVAEVEKCAWVCSYYAEHAESMLEPVELPGDAASSAVRHLPLGPVLAVMPWNFPFWQVFRFAAPALMAGNVVVLKHASNVPRTSRALEQLFVEAGFDEGMFQSLLVGPDAVPKV
ncbi:MAG: aldehyde dehydrogenase family protein, partial [Gammaproteobacteria bacterium]|nr:aldehyde dehydrogenase family protein [Gammaproteobacteria bacterium]